MKTEPSSTLRKVWQMKQAAQKETSGLSGHELFLHIRRRLPELDLPSADHREKRPSSTQKP